MYIENLTEKNYILYAAKYYDNVNCSSTKEFMDDLERIIYIKRIFNKYKKSGLIQRRLVLNHLTVLYNVFNSQAITRILFLKLKDHWCVLKPFLLYLNKLPNYVMCIEDININTIDIPMDEKIIEVLRRKND